MKFIKAWCPKCGWTGIAAVGNGITIEDYECPKCGYLIKRPYRGTRNLILEEAKLREEILK